MLGEFEISISLFKTFIVNTVLEVVSELWSHRRNWAAISKDLGTKEEQRRGPG